MSGANGVRLVPLGAVGIALLLCAAACTQDQCARALDKYCSSCPTFEAAFDVAMVHGDPGSGWGDGSYDGDVFIYECENETRVIQVQIAGSLAGRDEYYDGEAGRLLGVMEWSDTPLSCGLGRAWTYVYGDSNVACQDRCLLDYSCVPADDPYCTDVENDVERC